MSIKEIIAFVLIALALISLIVLLFIAVLSTVSYEKKLKALQVVELNTRIELYKVLMKYCDRPYFLKAVLKHDE